MPITKELDNIRKFESVGFTHEQAETLTDVIEQSHVDGQQSLKESIHKDFDDFRKEVRKEIDDFCKEIRNEIGAVRKEMGDFRKDVSIEINTLELRIKASYTDLLVKIFGIVAGCTTIAISVAKLLW